jgi:hypothetical protein
MTSYDNRMPRRAPTRRPAAAAARLLGRGTGKSHFVLRLGDTTLAYCYIRKNACSSFKRLFAEQSPHTAQMPADGNPIRAMRRFHAARSLRELEACDHRIFVYRCPLRRVSSLFVNKFVMRREHDSTFENYRSLTGADPTDASFADLVERYLRAHPWRALDLHLLPQAHHLHPIRYTDAIHIDELCREMTGILGADLGPRYFCTPVNASVGTPMDPAADAADTPARTLTEAYRREGVIPRHANLVHGRLATALAEAYADDLALLARLRPPAQDGAGAAG